VLVLSGKISQKQGQLHGPLFLIFLEDKLFTLIYLLGTFYRAPALPSGDSPMARERTCRWREREIQASLAMAELFTNKIYATFFLGYFFV
jgi:hypothetical protein